MHKAFGGPFAHHPLARTHGVRLDTPRVDGFEFCQSDGQLGQDRRNVRLLGKVIGQGQNEVRHG